MRTSSTLLVVPLFFLPWASRPSAQVLAPAPLAPTPLSATGLRFGHDLADAGDVDGDGHSDLVVLSLGDKSVRVFSGVDRTPLLALSVPATGSTLVGRAAGDVDADGYGDLIVGAPEHDGGSGRVIVFSGRSGATLFIIDGASGSRLGAAVTAIGDVNDDGRDDVAAGAPSQSLGGIAAGMVRVYSGVAGGILATHVGLLQAGASHGAALASAGDVDADGFEDLLIGAPGSASNPQSSVHVYSPRLQITLRTHQGPLGWRLGASVAGLGDLNGDGRPDYGAGAPGYDATNIIGVTIPDAGIAWAWSGLDGSGLGSFGVNFFAEEAMGSDLAPAGDLDGDGVPDVLVCGQRFATAYSGASSDSLLGAMQMVGTPSAAAVDDPEGGGLSTVAFASPLDNPAGSASGSVVLLRFDPLAQVGLLTPASDERFGAGSALLSDVDGDGRDEVLIGAPYRDANGADSGVARLHSGADGALLWEVTGGQGDQLGAALASLGDVTGDGIADALVGAPFDLNLVRSGLARVVSGADGALVRSHLGQSAGDRCGAALASLGDVNGDGIADYALGSPGAASSLGQIDVGAVRVYSGATGQLLWSAAPPPNARSVRFGSALARVDDVDGDGRAELLVGAPHGGGVQLRSGTSGALIRSIAAPSGSVGVGARFGAALAGPGDVDGDGVPDLLIGAPGYDGGKGRAWVHSGADGSVLHTVEALSLAPDERLGSSVAGPGDADNDGVPDFAVGAPRASILFSSSAPGAVGIFSGATGTQLRKWNGSASGERFGASLASGGDVDGDGLGDLVAGAPRAELDPEHAGHGRASVPSPRVVGSEHYGTGTPGCAGPHLLTLGQVAFAGGTLELRASGLTPQALPVLWLAFGAFEPGIPVLGGAVLLSVDVTQPAYAAVLPSANGHLATALPIPNNPAWNDLTLYAQLIQLWPGGCAALPAPYSSSNGLQLLVH